MNKENTKSPFADRMTSKKAFKKGQTCFDRKKIQKT